MFKGVLRDHLPSLVMLKIGSRKSQSFSPAIGSRLGRKAHHASNPAWFVEGGGSATLSDRLISNWAKHRFVAASSLSTGEKVASLKGSGKH